MFNLHGGHYVIYVEKKMAAVSKNFRFFSHHLISKPSIKDQRKEFFKRVQFKLEEFACFIAIKLKLEIDSNGIYFA